MDSSCATFALDVLAELVDFYEEKDLRDEVTNFIVQMLTKDETIKNLMTAAIMEKANPVGKAWRSLRGEKAIVETLVKTYINDHEVQTKEEY